MVIALIPARGGSKRIPGKNIKEFAGHPLLAYTIAAAQKAGIFRGVYVSTEDHAIKRIAERCGVDRVIERPHEYAQGTGPDVDWVKHALARFPGQNLTDQFMILRPTNPFRTAETIKRAWELWKREQPLDSMRAVQPISEHPDKMWTYDRKMLRFTLLKPLRQRAKFLYGRAGHDMPTQRLQPDIVVQNGCIHIASVRVVRQYDNYTGSFVAPFHTEGYEGFDLNTPDDWFLAEALVKAGKAKTEVIL